MEQVILFNGIARSASSAEELR